MKDADGFHGSLNDSRTSECHPESRVSGTKGLPTCRLFGVKSDSSARRKTTSLRMTGCPALVTLSPALAGRSLPAAGRGLTTCSFFSVMSDSSVRQKASTLRMTVGADWDSYAACDVHWVTASHLHVILSPALAGRRVCLLADCSVSSQILRVNVRFFGPTQSVEPQNDGWRRLGQRRCV